MLPRALAGTGRVPDARMVRNSRADDQPRQDVVVEFIDDDAAAGLEELDVGKPLLPPRVSAFVGSSSGRRIGVALLAALVLAAALTGIVQYDRHGEHVAAARRTAAAAHRATHRRVLLARRSSALAMVRNWAADDDPIEVTTLSSVRTPGCKNVDAQQSDPPQSRATHELLAAFPGFRPRAVSRTIDESGWLCALTVSISDGRSVVVLRADPMLRRSFSVSAVTQVSGGDSVGYAAKRSTDGWTTVVGWRGPAGYSPPMSTVWAVATAEAHHW